MHPCILSYVFKKWALNETCWEPASYAAASLGDGLGIGGQSTWVSKCLGKRVNKLITWQILPLRCCKCNRFLHNQVSFPSSAEYPIPCFSLGIPACATYTVALYLQNRAAKDSCNNEQFILLTLYVWLRHKMLQIENWLFTLATKWILGMLKLWSFILINMLKYVKVFSYIFRNSALFKNLTEYSDIH